ncbi:NAD-dependent protein deacetylase of SIR2 family [Sandaracinus amylolyticus]|uniref:NAD-dependent protein deacetylase n=2 Tax=Sandaracinus amylolyticus TaxID=927083 RepID=A0A0F6W2R7_9BACT|nr:NAD-dependent protein deacetylase [Sandaracinus amylolyticus]AKF05942.1 NAD-dependent protein deacetylase of SIR2 family [Sandaracinus amylolyticus]
MTHDLEALCTLLAGRRVVALTGAGCSTESGIPDYRGEGTRKRARNPMQYRAFLHDARARARYWARSLHGWPRIAGARPNDAHRALASMEREGALVGLITQNVDRLHHAAGSARVIELHGALAEVRCLACGTTAPRADVQARLLDANPGFVERPVELNPDGDAELEDDALDGFRVVACEACGGVLKPDVVFFGDSVPRPRVDAAHAMVRDADAMLVVGSSLAVYSGLRFVRAAAERAIPIAILNVGETRGDALATLRVDARAGAMLPLLAQRLSS